MSFMPQKYWRTESNSMICVKEAVDINHTGLSWTGIFSALNLNCVFIEIIRVCTAWYFIHRFYARGKTENTGG